MPRKGEFLTEGWEKIVYTDANSEKRIIKEYKYQEVRPRVVLARGYLCKILHILLPDNIPNLHMSSASPHRLVMEKKRLDALHQELASTFREDGLSEEEWDRIERLEKERADDPRVRALVEKLREWISLQDAASVNFGLDEQGNVVYVDTFEPWSSKGVPFFRADRLVDAIEALIDDSTKERARFYLRRLQTLFEEERADLSAKT